jgi:23S rRNA U2552 (ribose-2'-O)-methylase RlmE/FtsJ
LVLNIKLDKQNLIWLDTLSKKQGISPIVANFDDRNAKEDFDDFLNYVKGTDHSLFVDLNIYDTVNFESYRNVNDYKGLFVVKSKEQAINELLAHGADFVFKRLESPETFSSLETIRRWSKNHGRKYATHPDSQSSSKQPTNTYVNPTQELNHIAFNMQAKSTALNSK